MPVFTISLDWVNWRIDTREAKISELKSSKPNHRVFN